MKNKIDMITVYSSLEHKLIKQQEAHLAATGTADEELTRKIELVQSKIANCNVGMYSKVINDNHAFMAQKLGKYGIFI